MVGDLLKVSETLTSHITNKGGAYGDLIDYETEWISGNYLKRKI